MYGRVVATLWGVLGVHTALATCHAEAVADAPLLVRKFGSHIVLVRYVDRNTTARRMAQLRAVARGSGR